MMFGWSSLQRISNSFTKFSFYSSERVDLFIFLMALISLEFFLRALKTDPKPPFPISLRNSQSSVMRVSLIFRNFLGSICIIVKTGLLTFILLNCSKTGIKICRYRLLVIFLPSSPLHILVKPSFITFFPPFFFLWLRVIRFLEARMGRWICFCSLSDKLSQGYQFYIFYSELKVQRWFGLHSEIGAVPILDLQKNFNFNRKQTKYVEKRGNGLERRVVQRV